MSSYEFRLPGPPNGLMLSRGAAPHSSRATRSVARNERRKPRASERRYVGSCNELARGYFSVESGSHNRSRKYSRQASGKAETWIARLRSSWFAAS